MHQVGSLIHPYGWIIPFYRLSFLSSTSKSAKMDAQIDFRLAGFAKSNIFEV